MVPMAAVFVIGDDNCRVRPERGIGLHGSHEACHVLLTLEDACVTGMLVVLADRFDEAHRGQSPRREIVKEVGFILQMRRGVRIPTVSVAGVKGFGLFEEGESLMAPLEKRVNGCAADAEVRRIARGTIKRGAPSA